MKKVVPIQYHLPTLKKTVSVYGGIKMADEGWIKLHRQIINSDWFTDVNTNQLFIYCILRANFEPTSWRGIKVERGQFITSLEKLSASTGLSVRQVRTALKKLKATNNVTSKSSNQNTIITVLSYDKYQASDKQPDKRATNERQTDDKRATTDKNIRTKEEKELKNIIEQNFKEFWSLYIRKKDKKKCFTKYEQLIRNKTKHEDIILGTKAYMEDCEKKKTEVQFIKLPFTFLNGENWNDEYETKVKDKTTYAKTFEEAKKELELWK